MAVFGPMAGASRPILMDMSVLRERAALIALIALLGGCTAPPSEPVATPAEATSEATSGASRRPAPERPEAVADDARAPVEARCEVAREVGTADLRALLADALEPAVFVEREAEYVYPVDLPPTRLRLQTWPDRPYARPAALARDPSLVHLVTRELPAISGDGEVVVEAIHNDGGRVVLAGLELAFFDARSGALIGMLAVPEGIDPRRGHDAALRPCAALGEANRLLAAGRFKPLSRILRADFPHWTEPGRDPRWRDVWEAPPASSLRERREGEGPASARARRVGSKVEITVERGPVGERFSFAARPWTMTEVYADAEGRVALVWSTFDVRGCGECNRDFDLRVVPLAGER